MIDFRYHLVSLISVFLALAVGIVLGAGPLQESIGDTLTDQIDVLRSDRDQLRLELAEQTVAVADRDAWITDVGEKLVADSLAGHSVAVVALPGATDDDVAAVSDQLDLAGAAVVVEARLTEAWVETDLSYRQTFSQQLAGYLDPVPADDATSEEVLATAVAQMLSGATEDAGVLAELLAGGEDPFIALTAEAADPAGSLIVVGPRPTPPAESTDATATPTPEAAQPEWARVVSGFAATVPTVTVGAAEELVLSIREAGIPTSTIDSIGEVPTTVTVPLALAAELTGSHGRYGFAPSAQAPAPRLVEVPPPTPVAPDPTAEATATEGADG
ncbi:MAG: copper transporter [Actinomycetota bacterium]